MSKILKISKHKLDLAQVELTGPSLIIGRSPLCDQVLRAPGIKPVHFLLEWIGEGEFNSNEGMWTLFDMGHLVSNIDSKKASELNRNDFSAEGFIIDDEQQYLGLNWTIVEDRIKATNIQKGIISNQIIDSTKKKMNSDLKKAALEIVCLNKKEQSVLEIWHFFEQKVNRKSKKREIPFDVEWNSDEKALFKFDLIERPQAIFNLKGQKFNINEDLNLAQGETFIVHFSEEIYFLRFVSRVEYEAVHLELLQNKFWIASVVSLFLFIFLLYGIKNTNFKQEVNEKLPEPRVVKIVEAELAPPVIKKEEIKPIPPKVEETVKKEEIVEKTAPPAEKEIVKPIKEEKKGSTAAAPTFKSDAGKVKAGLNSPAKVSDVNAVGLLGKMRKSSGGAPKQISAESISQTFVDDTASGHDNKGVIVSTAQVGVVGLAKNGTGGGGNDSGNNLMEAQTTLQGAKDFSANNGGPIAKAGGLKGSYTIGSGTGNKPTNHVGTGSGTGASTGDAGEVSGGLSKSQVFNVINAHRREIRTCFESALLVRNDLNGILRLSFGINLVGSVTEIKVVNSEIDSSILESCVIQVIRSMKFPESPNQLSTTVIYPFVFKRSF